MEMLESDSVGEDSNHSQGKYWVSERSRHVAQVPVIPIFNDNEWAPNWESLDHILCEPSDPAQGKHSKN